jgi:hypothetical protein
MTVPLLTDDGAEISKVSVAGRIARTSFPSGSDEQNVIALNPSSSLEDGGATMRSPYGHLWPVRVRTSDWENRIFIYPRNGGDPTAEVVRNSFVYNSLHRLILRLGKGEREPLRGSDVGEWDTALT